VTQVDLEHLYLRVMSALGKIAEGSKLNDWVMTKGDYGKEMLVATALHEAAQYLPEPFQDDDWDIVQAAFSRFNTLPPSRRIDECCRDLLKRMS
jgi:hypothetical protein